jgi:hypothetical protein
MMHPFRHPYAPSDAASSPSSAAVAKRRLREALPADRAGLRACPENAEHLLSHLLQEELPAKRRRPS